MKKILLATTVLAMSAGFAAADVKVSGSASMGIARDGGSDAVDFVQGTITATANTGNIARVTALHGGVLANFATAAATTTAAHITALNGLIATLTVAVADAEDDVAASIAATGASTTLLDSDLEDAEEDLAEALDILDEIDGTAAVAAVENEFHVYNSGELDFAATVVSDSGVEFGMSTSVSFGNSYSFGDGTDAFGSEDGTIGSPTLTVKGAFGKLTFADDGVDMLYDDGFAGDFGFDYSAGDLSFSMVSDVDASNGDAEWSANVGYTVSGVALSYTADSMTSYNASVSYTTGGITGTIETDSDAGADAVNTLTVAYSANGMSAEYSASSDDTWSASAGYSANGLSVDVSTDDEAAWEATTSYDLGGGATLVAGMNAGEEAYAGVDLSF
jgi:outer membrane protein OmpU